LVNTNKKLNITQLRTTQKPKQPDKKATHTWYLTTAQTKAYRKLKSALESIETIWPANKTGIFYSFCIVMCATSTMNNERSEAN